MDELKSGYARDEMMRRSELRREAERAWFRKILEHKRVDYTDSWVWSEEALARFALFPQHKRYKKSNKEDPVEKPEDEHENLAENKPEDEHEGLAEKNPKDEHDGLAEKKSKDGRDAKDEEDRSDASQVD